MPMWLTVDVVCHRRVGAPTADAVEFDIVRRNEVDLSEQTELMAEVVYNISMIAVNVIGESNSSNAVQFTRLQIEKCRSIFHT